MVGRQLPFMTIIVLFWIMAIMDGVARYQRDVACGRGCGRVVCHCSIPQL
ncbi:MAG: hypothetical protein ACLR17_11725 [Enterobacteriaceae bacterium]